MKRWKWWKKTYQVNISCFLHTSVSSFSYFRLLCSFFLWNVALSLFVMDDFNFQNALRHSQFSKHKISTILVTEWICVLNKLSLGSAAYPDFICFRRHFLQKIKNDYLLKPPSPLVAPPLDETVLHLFYECNITQNLWNELVYSLKTNSICLI